MNRDGYFEEKPLGKSKTLPLLKGLLPFFRPYRGLIVLSILLVNVTALIDLAVPYITKTAIDRHIVPQNTATAQSDPGGPAKGMRTLTIDLSAGEAAAIVRRYPRLFSVDGQVARIRYLDLKRIASPDLAVIRKPDLLGVARLAAIFLVLMALNFALSFYQRILMENAGHRIMNDLRLSLYRHIQALPVAFFNRNPVGRLVTRTTNDVQNMHELFTSVITFVFKDLFLLMGIAVVLTAMNWKLALAAFTIFPLVLYTVYAFSGRIRDVFRVLRIKVAEINTHFSETIAGIRVIQAYNNQRRNYRAFKSLNHENYLFGMRQIHIMAVFMPLIELLGVITIAVVLFYGGHRVIGERLSIGTLVAFISYMRMFFRPIRDLAEKYNILQNAMASAERIFLILENEPAEAEHALKPENRPQITAHASNWNRFDSLCFEKVSFGYHPSEMVLKDISFKAARGQTIAVVGATGSGKTSLINLIMRFYDPWQGRILINGHDMKTVPLADARSLMALVTQEPFLFSDTIRANIWTDRDMPDKRRIDQVLAAANCHDFVARLPKGVDTVLSSGGESISSGERQLICIARAFARNPKLILLDEATSYIDAETETIIQRAISRLMKGRTAIVVAHRLSTVRMADRILVVDGGRIVESGSHDVLMANKGFYYLMHNGTHAKC